MSHDDQTSREETRAIGRDAIRQGYGHGSDDYDEYPETVIVNSGERLGIMPGWMAELMARVEQRRQDEKES